MRISFKLLGISEAVLLLAVVLLLLPVRAKMKQQIVTQMQNELRAIAVNAAPLLSGRLHREVQARGADTPAFRSLRKILTAVRDANCLDERWIYTFYRDGDQVRFGVMTHETPFVGHAYPLRAGMDAVFERGMVHVTELYRDRYGEWISAYAPILEGNGTIVGLLEVDKPAEEYTREVGVVTAITIAIGLIGLAVTSLLGWRVLDAIVIGPMKQIREGVTALGRHDFRHRVELTTGDEFQDLGDTLDQISTQLDAAKVIQASFFPKTMPAVPAYRFAGLSIPCDATGGDYYDAIDLGGGRTAILVADVSGHGLGPSLLMASCRSATHALGREDLAPGPLIERLNRLLIEDLTEGRFITMVYGVLEPDGRFTYANAGHSPALVAHNGTVRHLATHRPPLGLPVEPEGEQQTTIVLEASDRVLFVSDGLTDALDGQGRYFGLEPIERAASDHEMDCRAVVRRLQRELIAHCHGPSRTDDVTILCVDRL